MVFMVEVRPQTTPTNWAGECREPLCEFVVNDGKYTTYTDARQHVKRIVDHATNHGWRTQEDECDNAPNYSWMVEESDGHVLYDVEILG